MCQHLLLADTFFLVHRHCFCFRWKNQQMMINVGEYRHKTEIDYITHYNLFHLFSVLFFKFLIGLNACEKKSYIFLRKELPVRLANIMKEIALLPDSLSRTPSVGMVSSWYARSFEEVLRYEQLDPTTLNMEKYADNMQIF